MDGRTGYARDARPALFDRLHACGLDVSFHRGRGDALYLRDDRGEEVEVLDLAGGFGAGLFGHNHPELVERARALLDGERPFLSQGSVREPAGRLGARVSELAGGGDDAYVVTLLNSGTEAVEAALKHAALERRRRLEAIAEATRRAAADRPERGEALAREVLALAAEPPRFLALERAFHGKTTGALQMTSGREYREPWQTLGVRTRTLPPEDPDALRRALDEATTPLRVLETGDDGEARERDRPFVDVAALFVEPLQGEGGVRVLSEAYLADLRAAADEGDFPLILDEVQSGMGRTGTFLAADAAGITGDYVLLAKALGGGLSKIAAMLVRRQRYVEDFGSRHSSTFAEDDRASELALGSLDLLDRDRIPARCRELGGHLLGRLHELARAYPDAIADVRGRGLMVGVELADQTGSPSPMLRALAEQEQLGFVVAGHLLHEERIRLFPTLSARTTLRVQPSAYVSFRELDRFVDALGRVCAILHAADAHALTRYLAWDETGFSARPPVVRPGASERTAPAARHAPAPSPSDAVRVGFLAHFTTPRDLAVWDPSLDPLDAEACDRLLRRVQSGIDPIDIGRSVVRSPTGSAAEVVGLAMPFTPEQVMESFRHGGGDWALELIDRGLEMAREAGCRVLGFGGYTSIVTSNCRDVSDPRLGITSGNALTAAAALEALFDEADRLGLQRRRLGVVGAAGNLGAVLAEVAAERADAILLVGRARARRRLEALRERLEEQAGVPVEITAEHADLVDCELVLSATNAPRPVVQPEHVGEGDVVLCDVAVPGDVDPAVSRQRPRAVVLRGGMVRTPGEQALTFEGFDLPTGEIHGCVAETIVLGLSERYEDFSRGPLSAARVRQARALARQHGFALMAGR